MILLPNQTVFLRPSSWRVYDEPPLTGLKERYALGRTLDLAVQKLPIIGDLVEEFELPDSTGTLRRLSELVLHGRLVLLFYRGNW